MHTTRSRFLSIPALATIAVSMLGAIAAPAAAQDGMRVARACVMQIQETTETNADRQHATTRRTVRAIREADEAGAPDRLIRSIAEAGSERVVANATRAKAVVHELATHCFEKLRELEADRSLFVAVRHAAMHANEAIEASTKRSLHAIRRAAAAATD